ncbi:MAG TPA: glycosyltransferase [Thermoanaerobaculia bacterium]|nr:glycosyltransferase [Thermoanaerobaculia bacterium]
MPEVSVVVPTHDRLEVLPEVIDALEAQQEAPAFEVIVVDDGSTDGTTEWLAKRRRWARVPFRVLSQRNHGPAAARNSGVAVAKGELVAFLGDDTVPEPGWLAAHRRAHAERRDERGLAVIGYTRWHPRMRLNPFLRYVNEHGLQFGYALIGDRENVPFNFFYTSNLSLRKTLLQAEPFDLRFPYPAWEDIEAGYRLQRHGLRLVYEPRAVAWHDHPTSFERFAARQEKAGYSAVVFHRLHPELGPFLGLGPDGPPPLPPEEPQRRREAWVRRLERWPVRLPSLWEETLRFHYVRGLHRGWRELPAAATPAGDAGVP